MPENLSKEEMDALLNGTSKPVKSTLTPQGNISPEEMKALQTGPNYHQSEDPSVLEGWRGKFRAAGAPLVRSGLINTGRLAGLATGIESGPGALGTMAIGGMAGDQVYQQMQKLFPDLYGENRNGVIDSVKESANNSALEMIGNDLFGKASKYLGDTIPKYIPGTEAWKLKKMRANLTPEEIEAFSKAPKDLNMSAGQVTNSKGWQQVEDLFGNSSKKHNIVEPAKKVMREEVDKIGQSVSARPNYTLHEAQSIRGQNAEKLASTYKKAAEEHVDDAFTDFRKNYKHLTYTHQAVAQEVDPITGQQIVKYKKVESPIRMTRTSAAAKDVVAKIDQLLENPNINGFEETVKKLQEMRNAADGFVNLTPEIKGGKVTNTPVMDWESAKINRSTAYDRLNDLTGTAKKELTGVYEKLAGAMSGDMDHSINHEWQSAARNSVNKANTLFKQVADRYDSKLAKELLNKTGDPELTYQAIFKDAMSDPEKMGRFVTAIGDAREAGAEYVTQMFKTAEMPDGSFDGKKLKDALLGTKEIARVPLSAPQRAGLDYLSTVLQHTGMSQSGSGTYALAFRQGSAIIGVSGALASIFAGDNVPSSAKYGAATLLAVPLAGAFTKRVLLNPTNVRKLALLAKLPPGSQKATLLSKSILTTLKGAGAEIQYYNQKNAPSEEESVEPE